MVHAFDHFRSDFDEALESSAPFTLNPGLFDCSTNEGFVGRIARQSRRVGFRRVNENLVQAYLVKAKIVVKRWKKQRGSPR